jgi:hypothetical protein
MLLQIPNKCWKRNTRHCYGGLGNLLGWDFFGAGKYGEYDSAVKLIY